MSDRELLLEIHQMLCKICSYIDKMESPEYKSQKEDREFAVNIVANLCAEQLYEMKCKNTINF